ncbi:3-oxoacyl-[acyl-carrier-protein] synthase III C-terminal domain-containing protein [Streptomyces aureocirculatus]|uniref:3-oxoacyl-[acyl-carrier-protein] synthase III C-terminal domain-containing protein n=1 Tax=Streptomyces aureocirculatus TaxID=67275 RepID=UPI0004CA97BD|nr:3-oxoacyl-[acyl-carrier-protein] synthase III C-terminal domain-containing protein [Streptomyces aureocirculatus]
MVAPNSFAYKITGLAVELGDQVDIATWAERAGIPDKKHPGSIMSGKALQHILGVTGKAWAPDRFTDASVLTQVARTALDSAAITVEDLDALILVSCTPFQVMLDQDALSLARDLGLPDAVAPLQLGAGCAGLARAAELTRKMNSERALVVTYNVTSRHAVDSRGAVYSHGVGNKDHPFGEFLWASAALFSDALAAVVLTRAPDSDGMSFYSRDTRSFAGGPGITDPLIHYPGGGAEHPPGERNSTLLMTYGMNSDEIIDYYMRGMLENHQTLEQHRPGYLDQVSRVYTHQASPRLVEAFAESVGMSQEKAPSNAARFGNTVSPSTLALLQEDLAKGALSAEDPVCFSVVGSGPERGAFITSVHLGSRNP